MDVVEEGILILGIGTGGVALIFAIGPLVIGPRIVVVGFGKPP